MKKYWVFHYQTNKLAAGVGDSELNGNTGSKISLLRAMLQRNRKKEQKNSNILLGHKVLDVCSQVDYKK